MKQIKKLLVVLPLVLVFVLSSMPVFAWPKSTNTETALFEITLGTTVQTLNIEGKEFLPESKFKDYSVLSEPKLVEFVISKSIFADDFANGKVDIDSWSLHADLIAAFTGTWAAVSNKSTITLKKVKEVDESVVMVAVDRLTLKRVPTTIYKLQNKNNAKSIYDMAHEFFDWEVAAGGDLKDYYWLGFAPDVNGEITPLEQEQLDKYGADILVWVVRKLQPLGVTHVFPDRAPLYETIMVDYWVLEKGQINNANAAEFAKTRIQKMNEQGYVFEKAEYTPYIYRESIMVKALDVFGLPIPVDMTVSEHGIFVYYKGAVVPAPVPDAVKKVDAASANTGVQANVQAPVAAAGAQPQQLPATGVADNAFLFLSSAALMALGIFFFKKH